MKRRAGLLDQRREKGGQRRDERRTRWMDVTIVRHAVILRHFVCFDVASAAAVGGAPGSAAGPAPGLAFIPSGPVRETGARLQHLSLAPRRRLSSSSCLPRGFYLEHFHVN